MEGAPKFDIDSDEIFCQFVDEYVRTTVPDEEEEPELYEAVSSVQTHRKKHTKSCKKGKKTCRFNFPRPPAYATFISRPSVNDMADDVSDANGENDNDIMNAAKAKEILDKLAEILTDETKQTEFSIEEALQDAGFTSYEEFQLALRILAKKPSVVLKRDVKDAWINAYNPALLLA